MAILVTCTCGKHLKVKDELAGKRGKCPACGQALLVPTPSQAPDKDAHPSGPRACPTCHKALPPEAVLCVNCGLDLRTGKKLAPVKGSPYPTRRTVALQNKPRSFWLGFAVFVFGGLSAVMLVLTAVGAYLVLRGPIETENKMVLKPRPGVIAEHKVSSVSFNPPVIIIPGIASVIFGGLFLWKFTKWKRFGGKQRNKEGRDSLTDLN